MLSCLEVFMPRVAETYCRTSITGADVTTNQNLSRQIRCQQLSFTLSLMFKVVSTTVYVTASGIKRNCFSHAQLRRYDFQISYWLCVADMSGIEVAGLILGAVPLIIAALEQYKKTRETIYLFRRKALYIDRLIDALEEQRVLIESDLNQLLRAAGIESDEVAAAGATSCHDLLQDPDIATEIAQYLGQTFQPYQKALKRC